MPSKVVFDWSDEQLDWFDLRHADFPRKVAREGDVVAIHAIFTSSNQYGDAFYSRGGTVVLYYYLNDKRREDGRFMSAAHIGHWSVEQYVWLDEHRIWLVIATALEDFDTFWIILFDDFFSEWPVRRFLWPTLEDDRPLSTVQQLLVTEAEE
ncbi:hypothetical protein EDD22DRAFT_855810 [Suillus occidentalis]|nr:hypothetical protein EDD22DRAFT_855810 [Suillus occidentalis]